MSLRIRFAMQWFFNEVGQINWDLKERRLSGQHGKFFSRVNLTWCVERVMFLKSFALLLVISEADTASEEMTAPWFETKLPTIFIKLHAC